MPWWSVVSLLIITFVSRWWPRLVLPDALGSDTYFHLFQAENIREHRFNLPQSHPQFVLPGAYVYPPGYHYLLALFPRPLRDQFEKISSSLFDVLLVLLFIRVSIVFLFPFRWTTFPLLLLMLAFIFSPALVGVSTGPRAYQGTARTVGEFLVAVAFVSLWQYDVTTNGGWLVLAVFAGASTLITSKFGAQVILLFSLLIAFMLNSATVALFPLICCGWAIVISRGHYARVLQAHIRALHNYRTNIAAQHYRTRKRAAWQLPRTAKEIGKFFLYENVYGVFVARFTVVLFTLIVIVWSMVNVAWLGEGVSFLFAWFVAALVTFMMVSTRTFSFIGEADRYLEFALVPTYLLLAILLPSQMRIPILISLLLLHCVLYFAHTALFLYTVKEAKAGWSEFLDAINEQGETVVLSLLSGAPWAIVYCTKHRVCFSQYLPTLYSEEGDASFFWRYPWPHPDFSYYIEEYDVGLVAASKWAVLHCRQEGCVYDFSEMDKIFENEHFLLYRPIPRASSS